MEDVSLTDMPMLQSSKPHKQSAAVLFLLPQKLPELADLGGLAPHLLLRLLHCLNAPMQFRLPDVVKHIFLPNSGVF